MAERAGRIAPPSQRTNCLYCGAELGQVASEISGLCRVCSARVAAAGKAISRSPQQRESDANAVALRLRRSHEALAELVAAGPSALAPEMVKELLATDKRISSWFAFVPFIGPWLLQRSELHSRTEKFLLTWFSIGLTTLGLWWLISRMPTPEDEAAAFHRRIDAEANALAAFADSYRAERGAYPDKITWSRFGDRADQRFFDPWGRRYRYEPGTSGITIGTLGRDGVEGGTGEDADISKSFGAATR
jgi:Type II secretion system (T2SS), protein G